MINSELAGRIKSNWHRVVDEVHDAAEHVGRSPDQIKIIGVSKYVGPEMTAALFDAGCQHLGESRPQQLWEKSQHESLCRGPRWHLIGHLQRNKVRRTLRTRPLIHSVDSVRLLHAIAEEATQQRFVAEVLLEVNISGDEAKTGILPEAFDEVFATMPIEGVKIVGLMAMAGWGTDSEAARHQFSQTRLLRERLAEQFEVSLPELSMGMSGDFAAAIAEGSTMVRIGSRLFEGIDIGR